MSGWFRRNWRALLGGACGIATPVVAVAVNPIAGVAVGAVCTYALGKHADTKAREANALGEAFGRAAAEVLERERQKGKAKP